MRARLPMLALLFGAMAAFPHAALVSENPNPRAILEKTLTREYRDLSLEINLVKVAKSGREREMELVVHIKKVDGVTKTRAEFTAPPEVAGITSLSWDYADKPADRWFKLSGLEYVKCAGKACESMEERFGFTMDIFAIDINDADHALLGEETRDGGLCYKIESKARRENSAGDRFITWVDKEMFAARRVEAYQGSELAEVSVFTGFDLIGSHWWETEGELDQLAQGKKLRFKIKSHQVDTGLADDVFAPPKTFKIEGG